MDQNIRVVIRLFQLFFDAVGYFVRHYQGDERIKFKIQLDKASSSRRPGFNGVDAFDTLVRHGDFNDVLPDFFGQFVIHQKFDRTFTDLIGVVNQINGDAKGKCGINVSESRVFVYAQRDYDADVHHDVAGVVRHVAGDGDRRRPSDDIFLIGDQNDCYHYRRQHDVYADVDVGDGIRGKESAEAFDQQKNAGTEDECRLKKTGDGFRFAVTETMLLVRRLQRKINGVHVYSRR